MCFEEYSLGMLQTEGAKLGGLGSLYGSDIGIFEIKVKRFMQIADSFGFGFAKTRHIDIQALGNIVPAFFIYNQFQYNTFHNIFIIPNCRVTALEI